MNSTARPNLIPPEVLVREARLAAALAAMEQKGSREATPLQDFRAAVANGDAAVADALVEDLVRGGFAEEALAVLRETRRPSKGGDPLAPVRQRLAAPAAKAQARRATTWQLDSRRASVRLAYEKLPPATDFDGGGLHRILLAAFRLEGLRLALDLGHHPRPLLQLGPPLPAGAGGHEELAEFVLQRAPERGPDALLGDLNARLPEGLRLHRWIHLPGYATPVAELAETSEWSWLCPAEGLEEARAATARFLAAATFSWDRAGKVGGQKQEKHVDLRPMVSAMTWEGGLLRFRTPMAAFGATNPVKLLGAVLGLDPGSVHGVLREAIILREDPRLAQSERFEPKLRNLYEDAVLLSGGSNITLVDDEDDEPLRLG